MQVLIDARLILPHVTGIGRYLAGLVQGLREIKPDHHYELWVQPHLPQSHPVYAAASRNISVRAIAISHMSIRQQWAVPIELRRRAPDVFHYPHFDLPWATQETVVATIHDLKYIARPRFFPTLSRIKRIIVWIMMIRTARRAQLVIADSESTRADIIRHLRADPRKIAVVPLGVDPVYFTHPPDEHSVAVRHRYGLEAPFLLFVGERRPHKNIPALLCSFSALRKRGFASHHLVIAGKGYAHYREPERLTEQLGLHDVVHFVDYVPDRHLLPLYHAADAFVLLSLYEGFGLPILEAMAAGTPVVASALTSLPEVVGDAGLLVAPDNPEEIAETLVRVLGDEDLRAMCIARGRERAACFTWQSCAAKTVAVYEQAAAIS